MILIKFRLGLQNEADVLDFALKNSRFVLCPENLKVICLAFETYCT